MSKSSRSHAPNPTKEKGRIYPHEPEAGKAFRTADGRPYGWAENRDGSVMLRRLTFMPKAAEAAADGKDF